MMIITFLVFIASIVMIYRDVNHGSNHFTLRAISYLSGISGHLFPKIPDLCV